MFQVENLNVYYGDSHVIRNIGFTVGEQETVAIMGRNGMGKTTNASPPASATCRRAA
jgi:urea transport system ATP-binding protein